MKVSLNWLRQYVKTSLSPDQIAEGLTDLGLECTYEKKGISFTNVVVANVVECVPHENSDHLSVCKIDAGDEENYTVVCGAPNVKTGISVPFAKIDATLDYGKFKIKKTKIRGVTSDGMICSEKELGLGDSHEGIMILSSSENKGFDFSKIADVDEDIIYDIDLTPNRGDCLGHLGVARELSLLNKDESELVNYDEFDVETVDCKESLSINIIDNDKCSRYAACVVRGVSVGDSPDWLRKSLESIGQKSINNVVDAANFILMDLGHPMHTFDIDKIKTNTINVRTAKANETIITLDDCEQKLDSDNLLICDGDRPIAIAGIIGSSNSGVDEGTENILIESAYFDPANIRKSSKKLGISTEASRRFERDTDINILDIALNKLAMLIKDVAGGEISSDFFDIYNKKHELLNIPFNIDKCNEFLGTDISFNEAKKIFDSLNIKSVEKDDMLMCTTPSFRNDLSREVDLYEEIARVFGYNKIENSQYCSTTFAGFVKDERHIDSLLRNILASNGFNEQYSNSLLNQKEIKMGFNQKADSVILSNPLSAEMEYLRKSLFPGLMKAVKFNESRQEKLFKLFEIGAVHSSNDFTNTKTVESFKLGLIWYGQEFDNWNNKDFFDFYYAKGEIDHLLRSIGIDKIDFTEQITVEGFDMACSIQSGKNHLGTIGLPDKNSKSQFSLKGNMLFAEIDILSICKSIKNNKNMVSDSNYFPFVNRDISILVTSNIQFHEIEKLILSADNTILKTVKMFDLYQDDKIDRNKKSMSLRMKFQSDKKTLQDRDVDIIMEKIVAELKSKFNAVQR